MFHHNIYCVRVQFVLSKKWHIWGIYADDMIITFNILNNGRYIKYCFMNAHGSFGMVKNNNNKFFLLNKYHKIIFEEAIWFDWFFAITLWNFANKETEYYLYLSKGLLTSFHQTQNIKSSKHNFLPVNSYISGRNSVYDAP